MTIKIDHDDQKAIEMAIELIIGRELRSLRASDIEDVLDMEFDNYTAAMDTVDAAIKEFAAKKGL